MKHGKKYVDSAKLVDRTKSYEADEALAICCQTAKAKSAANRSRRGRRCVSRDVAAALGRISKFSNRVQRGSTLQSGAARQRARRGVVATTIGIAPVRSSVEPGTLIPK